MIEVIKKNNLYMVKVEEQNEVNHLTHLFNNFTVTNDEDTKFFFIKKDENSYIFPKYFDIREFLHVDFKYSEDTIEQYEADVFNNISHKIKLRNEKQEKTWKFLEENDKKDCLISLSTGSGKTVITIKYFIDMKLKPVIFCHNLTILKQWVEKITQLTELTEDDIGIIDSKWSKKKCSGKKVFVVSTPTYKASINSTDYEKYYSIINFLNGENIGVLVVDEAHKSFNTINHALMNIKSFSRILLTATPRRSLKKEHRLLNYCYPISNAFEIIEYEQPIDFYACHFDSNPLPKNYAYICNYNKYNFDRNRYINYLMKKPNNSYGKLVEYFYSLGIKNLTDNKKNKTLLIGTTVKQLDYLFDFFKEKYPEMKIKKFYSKHKKEEANITKTGDDTDLILAIAGSVDAGLDIEDLTLVINLTYVKSTSLIIQLKGRLARTYEGKSKAIYLSVYDNSFKFSNTCYTSNYRDIAEERETRMFNIPSGIVLPLSNNNSTKQA